MSYYTDRRHSLACQYINVDVPQCHAGDLNPFYTQHKHMDSLQHIHVDVHSEASVRKKNNFYVKITKIKFHENLFWESNDGNGKRNLTTSPF